MDPENTKEFRIVIEEMTCYSIVIPAENPEQAEELFWDGLKQYDNPQCLDVWGYVETFDSLREHDLGFEIQVYEEPLPSTMRRHHYDT